MADKEVVRMLANLAHIQSSNKAQGIALLAEAIAELGSRGEESSGNPDVSFTPSPPEGVEEAQSKTRKKEPVKNQVLCRAGHVSSCASCGRDVYKLSRDVHDGMSAEDFAASFHPVGDSPRMEVPLAVQFIDDSALMTCPLCKSELQLALWGRVPAAGKQQEYTDVQALGNEEIEGLL